jgi:ubiquitin thioesterase OTU1
MRLRLRHQHGNRVVDANEGVSLREFISLIETDQSGKVIALKNGFPPRPLALDDGEALLTDLGIKNGDQIIVEYGAKTGPKNNGTTVSNCGAKTGITKSSSHSDIPSVFVTELQRYLILRNIPDDNSCLFNAVLYAANGYNSPTTAPELRQVVVNYIRNDPIKYNDIVLGRPVEEYCAWISKKDSWGGAIELGILSDWLSLTIYCLDIELGKFIKFENNDNGSNDFCVLIYSGIHYDLVVLNTTLSVDYHDKMNDSTKWKSEIHGIITTAGEKLCKLLQTENYSTNTTTFRLRCLDCYKILVGEMGASNHANDTGHYNFGEVK